MSRIGNRPIPLPQTCTVSITGQQVAVTGPKGTLSLTLRKEVTVAQADQQLVLSVKDPANKEHRSYWGLYRALLRNMVEGVVNGFEKKLELQGVGYRVQAQGNTLVMNLGFSHPVNFSVPAQLSVRVEKNSIILQGTDKQTIGEIAAQIRRIRPPEPYKGKGIRYAGEAVRRKVGKVVKAAGAA